MGWDERYAAHDARHAWHATYAAYAAYARDAGFGVYDEPTAVVRHTYRFSDSVHLLFFAY